MVNVHIGILAGLTLTLLGATSARAQQNPDASRLGLSGLRIGAGPLLLRSRGGESHRRPGERHLPGRAEERHAGVGGDCRLRPRSALDAGHHVCRPGSRPDGRDRVGLVGNEILERRGGTDDRLRRAARGRRAAVRAVRDFLLDPNDGGGGCAVVHRVLHRRRAVARPGREDVRSSLFASASASAFRDCNTPGTWATVHADEEATCAIA